MGNYQDTENQRYPKPGDKVKVIQKKDYATGELTLGVVRKVLTKALRHPRGHKVLLESGVIGRVQEFVDGENRQPDPKSLVKYSLEPDSEDDLR